MKVIKRIYRWFVKRRVQRRVYLRKMQRELDDAMIELEDVKRCRDASWQDYANSKSGSPRLLTSKLEHYQSILFSEKGAQ